MTEKRPATASRGMVVTNHPLGSAAGAEMLAAGGNAVDAAIGALFALTVVEPMMVGIFGAGMTHLRLADGRHLVIDNYTTAPAAEAVEAPRIWSQGQELEMEQDIPAPVREAVAARGHRVVAVPGVAGGMNAVAFAADGTLEGAACWRADGTPIGVSGGLARPGIRFRPDANRR